MKLKGYSKYEITINKGVMTICNAKKKHYALLRTNSIHTNGMY